MAVDDATSLPSSPWKSRGTVQTNEVPIGNIGFTPRFLQAVGLPCPPNMIGRRARRPLEGAAGFASPEGEFDSVTLAVLFAIANVKGLALREGFGGRLQTSASLS
jgi:hypothetical protein